MLCCVKLLADVEWALAVTRVLCTLLLGPDAVDNEITEYGCRLEIIGCTIDLNSGLVTIARKSFRKKHSMSSLKEISKDIPKKT